MGPSHQYTGLYLAQVESVLREEHALSVLLSGLSTITGADGTPTLKVRVMEHRAGPWVGTRDLPRVGDQGVVAFLHGSEHSGVWLGSLYQDLDNIVTRNHDERLSHHDSGVWSRLDKDGQAEWSHPSGTYLRVGSGTALTPDPSTGTPRSRHERQGRARRTVAYNIPSKPVPTVHLHHSSGTEFTIAPDGAITITGTKTQRETIAQAVTEHYKSTWSLTVDDNGTVTGLKNLLIQADDVTIISTHAAPGAHMHLGGTGGEDFIALRGGLQNIQAVFNGHTHPDPQGGNTSPPTQQITLVSDADYTGQSKAT